MFLVYLRARLFSLSSKSFRAPSMNPALSFAFFYIPSFGGWLIFFFSDAMPLA